MSITPRFAISATFFAIGCNVALVSVMLPLIRLKFGFSEAEFGRFLLAFGCGALVALPLARFLLARYASATITRLAVFMAFIALALPALMPVPSLLVVTVFLAGVLLASADISMNANAVAVERLYVATGKGPMLSSCHGWYSAGGLAGLLIGPVGEMLGLEWMAILACATVLLFFALVNRGLLYEAPESSVKDPAAPARAFSPLLLVIGLAALVAFTAEGAVIDWSGVYLDTVMGVEPALFGLGFAAFSLSMAIMRFSGDALRARFGDRRVIAISLIVGAMAYLVIVYSPNVVITTLGYSLLGLGLANVVPVYFLMAANVPGLPHGSGLTLVVGLGYIGLLTFPPLIGWVAEAWSLRSAFAGLSVMLLLSLLVLVVVPARASRTEPVPA
ncbi:MFS transporter [Allohahella marinimesophila]|uniref:MFS transporter n=1 Tax=Allohahella marinimesophila TaxID=1054972 RepID=A0ABP7NVW7_9GAMM